MSKKKRPDKAPRQQPVALPVTHGDCFRTFIDEATKIGNEVMARRQFDADVIEYLTQKGLMNEWSQWLDAKRAPR
jgi:hypothetical protein